MMSQTSINSFWRHLARSKEVGKVSEELAGEKAKASLLAETGYANQPGGLCGRLISELARNLPLTMDHQSLRSFGSILPGEEIMAAAWREAGYAWPESMPGLQTPASQIRLSPEETAIFWPWLSGQLTARLARALVLTSDPELALATIRSLDRFCRFNPPLMGPGWMDTTVIAVRALNWLVALRLMDRVAGVKPEIVVGVLLHLRVMGLILSHQLKDLHQAPQPVDVGPAAALLFLGHVLNFLPEAPKWVTLARESLGPALAAWSKTGLYIPAASPAEAMAAAEWGCLGLWLSLRGNIEVPGLVGGLRKLAWLCRTSAPPWGAGLSWGWTPASPVLDFDEGRMEPYTGIANLAAVLLNEPDLRANRILDERLFWLWGPKAGEKLRLLAGGRPPTGKDIPGTGLSVFCAETNSQKVSVFLRTAPRFRKKVQPLDAQALSMAVSLNGQGLLVPPGPAGSGPLSSHLAGRCAFNAVMVDQSEPLNGKVVLESLESSSRHAFLSATYDGYTYLTDPVSLRRRVFLDFNAGLLDVVDQIQGQGEHLCEVFFHLPPKTQVSQGAGGALILSGAFGLVLMRPEPKAQVEVFQGSENPPLGWLATRMGEIEPAPVVVLRAKVSGSARITTVFVLQEPKKP